MNTIYIDNRMGLTGAKLFGALLELTDNPDLFLRRFNELGFKGLLVEKHQEAAKGVSGTRMEFRKLDVSNMYADEWDDEDGEAPHHHSAPVRRTLEDVKALIEDLPLSGKVRKRALSVYDALAEASAKANHRDIATMILNRTGSRDVIASVVGVCMLVEELEYEQIVASPIAVGSGYAYTSRGNMPIPIPALQELLDGIPYSAGTEEGEICTLEGAALIKSIADNFGEMPEMTIIRSGAGFGRHSYKSGPNCLKVYFGEIVQTAANAAFTKLEATLYSDSAQALLLAADRLTEAGAVDAYTIPIATLRGGRGFVLRCICPNEKADDVAGEILRNTSAVLVQRSAIAAYETEQTVTETQTSIGRVAVIKTTGFGISDVKPSPADVVKAAREHDISYKEAYDIVVKEIL